MTITILRTDGTEERHDINRTRPFAKIQRLIGADVTDTVDLRDGRVMVVDDNGWECDFVNHGDGRFEMRPLTPRKPINEKATALYRALCKPETTHQIAGDVAIAMDEDFA